MKVRLALNFNGNTKNVIEYYKDVFGMKVLFMMKASEVPEETKEQLKMDDDYVLHSMLRFENIELILADLPKDTVPERTSPTAPSSTIAIEADDEKQVDTLHNRLVTDGGMSLMEPNDEFWDARFAMAMDKFGVTWMFNCQKKA